MDLDLKLVSATLEILKETGTYPQTDNCYEVKITYPDGTGFTASYMPKPVWHMATTLQLLRKENKLSDHALISIIKNFNDYGDWMWSEANFNASMNTEDI